MENNDKIQNELSQIIQSYIGMQPKDKQCKTWFEMQYKMQEEINALFPTPTTVESPFSKEELEVLISDEEHLIKQEHWTTQRQEWRKSIITKANHLLTAANDWPKMMEVWDEMDGESTETRVVEIIDMYKGQYVMKETINDCYITFKHARPIQQKPKELKDLKRWG